MSLISLYENETAGLKPRCVNRGGNKDPDARLALNTSWILVTRQCMIVVFQHYQATSSSRAVELCATIASDLQLKSSEEYSLFFSSGDKGSYAKDNAVDRCNISPLNFLKHMRLLLKMNGNIDG